MRKIAPLEWSYQHLDRVVIAFLRGRMDMNSAVGAVLESNSREQIRAVLLNEGERYRRFNYERFRDIVERLRQHGILS